MTNTPQREDLPYKINRIRLAERFSWTLEYIDQMEYSEYRELIEILDGLDKARTSER